MSAHTPVPASPARTDYLRNPYTFLAMWVVPWAFLSPSAYGGDGSVHPLWWVVLAACVGLSFSVCLRWKPLEKLGWNLPRRWFYWPLAAVSGFALSCGYIYFVRWLDLPRPAVPAPQSLALQATSVATDPVLEEIVFRCWILAGSIYLLKKMGVGGGFAPWAANLFTAVLFALLHPEHGWLPLLDRTLAGLLFGWVRLRSNSVAAAAVCHSAGNVAINYLATPILY